MENKSMTALVSCFVRAYHYRNNSFRIFSDPLAEKILSREEYGNIAANMSAGIKFFCPDFSGTEEEALRQIVDNQLSPSVLGRSAFCEKALINEMRLGCNQYIMYASGYETLAYKECFAGLKIFEIDRKEMIEDKFRRLKACNADISNADFIECDFSKENPGKKISERNFDPMKKSFNSLLGISYYLTKTEFSDMIKSISNITCEGSCLVFDYPTFQSGKETRLNEKLAEGANEKMKSKYTYEEIEKILSDNGFLIYEHLDDSQMTKNYFEAYNRLNPNNKIAAPKGTAYCLAVKK